MEMEANELLSSDRISLRLVVAAAATVSVALMASSILLFMRDVKQFIYFQF